jgi:WD40 repeat protein
VPVPPESELTALYSLHALAQTARIFSVGNGKEIQCIDCFKGPVLSAIFTVDSAHGIAGSSTGQLVVFDASSGQVVQTIQKAHSSKINSLAASADGKLLVSGSSDKSVKVWRSTDGECKWVLIKTLTLADEVTGVAWSPDQVCLKSSEVSMRMSHHKSFTP